MLTEFRRDPFAALEGATERMHHFRNQNWEHQILISTIYKETVLSCMAAY